MSRSHGAVAGFGSRAATTFRLRTAIAASIAIGAISLCLIVAITVLSIKVVAAMPLPA